MYHYVKAITKYIASFLSEINNLRSLKNQNTLRLHKHNTPNLFYIIKFRWEILIQKAHLAKSKLAVTSINKDKACFFFLLHSWDVTADKINNQSLKHISWNQWRVRKYLLVKLNQMELFPIIENLIFHAKSIRILHIIFNSYSFKEEIKHSYYTGVVFSFTAIL